jgi:hypothetical protein
MQEGQHYYFPHCIDKDTKKKKKKKMVDDFPKLISVVCLELGLKPTLDTGLSNLGPREKNPPCLFT